MDTYEANVRIKDLPRRTDNIMNALAAVQGRNKWELVRDALNEYVNNHSHELVAVTKS